MQTNTKKQTMSTKPTTTAPAAPAAPKPTHPAPVDYAADFEAMQEAERTHTITLHFTEDQWNLLHEDIRHTTFQNGMDTPAPTFSEWLEAAKYAILAASARDCALAYGRLQNAAKAAAKLGFAFEDLEIWK